jgi:hypothetical protein
MHPWFDPQHGPLIGQVLRERRTGKHQTQKDRHHDPHEKFPRNSRCFTSPKALIRGRNKCRTVFFSNDALVFRTAWRIGGPNISRIIRYLFLYFGQSRGERTTDDDNEPDRSGHSFRANHGSAGRERNC